MLILDKSRALDLMVVRASREPVPEAFSLVGGAEDTQPGARPGFRVAVYGPIEPERPPDDVLRWNAQLSMAEAAAG
jgi:hypothetical protein